METTFQQKEGRRFSCPGCGGGLRYDIESQQMKCDHCGTLRPISELPAEPATDSTMEVTEFRCPQCGAAVYSSDTAVTSFCSFCGSDVVLTAKLTRTKRPASIVPFMITREQCEQKYREHLKKYKLVPDELRAAETISHFRAVYVPFWSYHVRAAGPMKVKGSKSYTKGETRYDETYQLTVDATIDKQGILYDASSAFEDETAAMLRHTVDQAMAFHPAYLSGFYAQAADVDPELYYEEAAATAVRLFLDKVREESGMDKVEVPDKAGRYFGLPAPQFSQELVMLPVWLLAHRDGSRVVYTAINGCSGQVVCDVPVSLKRVTGVAVTLTAAIFAALWALLTLKPGLLLALCAALCLITQYRFSHMYEVLFNREKRTFEPDYSGKRRSFVGPAQLLLGKKLSGDLAAKVKDIGSKIIGAIVVLFSVFSFTSLGDYASRLFSSLGGGIGTMTGDTIGVIILLICAAVMVFHTARRMGKPDRGPAPPRLLSCLFCVAGAVFALTGQAEDLLYYGCALGLLILTIIELAMIIRAHNEYASRPVPYFDGKEAAI